MSDDDRTTPLGRFNYARTYWQSAVLLHHARAKVTHPDAPVTLLLAHAIELYLKAFLRLRGVGIEEVRTTFGHDFKKLVDEASTRGLSLGKEEIDIAAVLTEKESIRRSRYIETGYYQRPGLAALSRTSQGLDQSVSAAFQSVSAALRDAGMSIQSAALNHIGAD
jgi:HEPN domain-containing protein